MAKLSNYLPSFPFIVEINVYVTSTIRLSWVHSRFEFISSFFDYLVPIEKKREKMLIFQYKSIVSLLKVGPSNMAAGLKS